MAGYFGSALASPANHASRPMIAASGLALHPDVTSEIAVRDDGGGRFTV